MTRSFRFQLAGRLTAAMAAVLAAVGLAGYIALRATLDRQINASLLNVASIQGASVAQPNSPVMRFHEWELTPAEAASIRDLNRYAEVWSEAGRSLLRTRYMTRDLPLDLAALKAAGAGRITWAEQRYMGIPIRSVFYPLGRIGAIHGQHVLQVAAPLDARNRTLRGMMLILVGLGLVATVGTFLGASWLAGRAVQPVHQITDQAEAIGAGTLAHRIRADAFSAEYQRLVQVLNTMLARLDGAFQSQRRFTADASHELRSPLTAMRGEIELALRKPREPEEYRRVLASVLEEVERLSETAFDLLTLARSDAGVLPARLRADDLVPPVRAAATRLGIAASEKGVELELDLPPAAPAILNAALVGRLAWNLIENAVKFTPSGGRVQVSVRADGDGPALEVADSGPGLPESDLPRLFDRFYRGDPARVRPGEAGGTGLGLSIVRAIAEAHDADLCATNGPAGGALFQVRFRAATPTSSPAPTPG